MEDIRKHFKEFYNKILFCGESNSSHIGEEEKTYAVNKYFYCYHDEAEEKDVISAVYEENEKDECVYIRLNGLVLTLMYGSWFNKKHKELDVYISKDPYYKGNAKASVEGLFKLLDDYINTHYKEYSEKINKVIVGTDKTKDIIVKYRNNNILTTDNIKVVSINDADVTDEDIEYLSRYKNLRNIKFANCHITADNFSLINSLSLYIVNSSLMNLHCLDNLHVGSLNLLSSKVEEDINKSLTLDVNHLKIEETDFNLELFFLMTNFKRLYDLFIDGKYLTPNEINLLKVFYQIKELAVDGESYSFDFLDDLSTLEQFRGNIKLVCEKDYHNYIDRYASSFKALGELDNSDEMFKLYIFNHIKDKVLKRKKFYKQIEVPRISQVKWAGYISTCKDEDVRKIVSLPWIKRRNLGREDEFDFKYVETEFTDPFNILSKASDVFLSKIVGPTGERLAKIKKYGYYGETDEYYIFGPDGRVYESLECTREKDILVPESISEFSATLAQNDNNVFDYYYNREVSEEEKIDFLVIPVLDYLYNVNDSEFKQEYEDNLDILKKLTLIDQEIEEVLSHETTLFYGPWKKVETTVEIRDGREVTCERLLPSEFLPEDFNLLQILKRTRNPEIIRDSLEKYFEFEKTSEEEITATWKCVYALLELWEQKDECASKAQERDEIVLKHFSKYFRNILDNFEKENYLNWYLDDFNNFLDRYELDGSTRELLLKYTLMRQSRYRADLFRELSQINRRRFILDEYYSVFSLLDWYKDDEDDWNFDKWFEEGKINKQNYDALKEYYELDKIADDLKEILDFDTKSREDAYQKMTPVLDNFKASDLRKIKDEIVVVDQFEDKFKKYVDFLYYYINGRYPKWIELELAKCPKLEEKYESYVEREVIPEHTLHLNADVKIRRNPFH